MTHGNSAAGTTGMETIELALSDRMLAVVWRPIDGLKPYKNNPRTHTKKQVRQIADSLKTFGWTNPVLIEPDGGIIAGHGRVEAAKLLKQASVPTIELAYLSEVQRRADIIADNRLAELAGWDEDLLAVEFNDLLELDDKGFSIDVIGFDMGDIDRILGMGLDGDEAEDVPLPETDRPAVSRLGALWTVGRHRILCGNSLEAESYHALLGNAKAAMVFTDPPYNVPVDGHVSGLGKVKRREFAMATGEMSKPEFTGFLKTVFQRLVESSADGSIHYVCMDWRHMGEMAEAGEGVYSELKNLCVWAKTNAGMGSFYRSQHELVFVFKAGRSAHVNNFGLGEKGRHRSNLWTYAGANTFRKDRMEDLSSHPTVKPTKMLADAILDCSKRNDLILDVFAGSGATLLAAEQIGRSGRGIELDAHYVDLIVRRLEEATGERAVRQCGRSLEDVHFERVILGEDD
jgi:DNA modification methylase